MRLILAATLMAASPAFAQAPAQTLPEPVRAMVEAAAQTGDKAKIDAVVGIAKQTNKGAEAQIDAIVSAQEATRKAAREAALREASYFDNWKGRGQLGAALSTGNSDIRSLTVGLNLQRDGLDWRHRVDAVLDLTDNRNGSDQERILAGYQIDYSFSDRVYSWGRLEYERNREAGIKRRFAQSAGLGWRAIRSKSVRWDLETGPAIRQTRFYGYDENTVAGRGASRFGWKLSPATEFTHDTAIFVADSTNVNTTAALTSRMFGSIGMRLSYNLVWEETPPTGLQTLDTTSRVTLVYDF